LNVSDALDVTTTLTPCFAYIFEKAAAYEMEARINYVSSQLENAQQSHERLARSKSDFIAVAAHELRTPLTLVEGYTAMLRESLGIKEPDSQYNLLLNGIDNGIQRLKLIIDDMIDVSMIDNNLLQLNFQPVWVNRLITGLVTELSRNVKDRKQRLAINKFPGWNELTFGDPERLLQVFRNILTNAIKFTPDEGSISISGRKLPGFLEFTVKDRGIGIDVEDQQIIFEKFGQLGNIALHSSGKTKFKGGGPGLGLPIAKGIIEAHGGAIWVESEGFDETYCPGSTFHILLTLRNAPPDDRAAKLFAALIDPHHLNATN
jgi:signal transduction histidine kinase